MLRVTTTNGSLIIYVSKNDSRELRALLKAASLRGFSRAEIGATVVKIVRMKDADVNSDLNAKTTLERVEIKEWANKPKISVGIDKGQGFEETGKSDTMLHMIEAAHPDGSRTVIMASHSVVDVLIWWADRKTKSVGYEGSKIIMHSIPCPTLDQTMKDVCARIDKATDKKKIKKAKK